jgi:hypothetical protein
MSVQLNHIFFASNLYVTSICTVSWKLLEVSEKGGP